MTERKRDSEKERLECVRNREHKEMRSGLEQEFSKCMMGNGHLARKRLFAALRGSTVAQK